MFSKLQSHRPPSIQTLQHLELYTKEYVTPSVELAKTSIKAPTLGSSQSTGIVLSSSPIAVEHDFLNSSLLKDEQRED